MGNYDYADAVVPDAQSVAAPGAESTPIAPAPTQTTYLQDQDQVVAHPGGMDAAEVNYAYETQVAKKPKSDFFGMQHIGDGIMNVAKGAIQPFAEAPAVAADREAEQIQVTAEEGKNALSPRELSARFNGTGTGLFGIASDAVTGDLFKPARDLTDTERVTIDRLRAVSERNDAWVKQHLSPSDESGVSKAEYQAGNIAGSIGAILGTSILLRNPAPAAAYFAAVQHHATYKQAREMGKTIPDAHRIANAAEIIANYTGNIGASAFLNAAMISPVIKRIAVQVGVEAATSFTAQMSQEGLQHVSGINQDGWPEAFGRALVSALVAGMVTVPMAKFHIAWEAKTLKKAVAQDLVAKVRFTPEAAKQAAEVTVKKFQEDNRLGEELHKLVHREASRMIDAEQELAATGKLVKSIQRPKEAPAENTKLTPGFFVPGDYTKELDKRIDDLGARENERRGAFEIVSEQLDELKAMHDFLRGSVDMTKGAGESPEEMTRIPKVYRKTGGSSLDEMLQEFTTQFPGLRIENTSDMIEFMNALYAKRKQLMTEQKLLRPEYKRMQANTVIQGKIKSLREGYEKGKVAQRAETKDVQRELQAVIDSANMTAEQRDSMTTDVRNAQTWEQLSAAANKLNAKIKGLEDSKQFFDDFKKGLRAEVIQSKIPPALKDKYKLQIEQLKTEKEVLDFADEIQNKLAADVETVRMEEFTQKINDLLDKTKTQIKSGKAVGRLYPEIQHVFDEARTLLKMGPDMPKEAQRRLDEHLAAFSAKDIQPPSYGKRSTLLNILANYDTMDSNALEAFYNELARGYQMARKANQLMQEQKVAKLDNGDIVALETIQGGKVLLDADGVPEYVNGKWKIANEAPEIDRTKLRTEIDQIKADMKNFFAPDTIKAWDSVLDKLSVAHKSSGPYNSPLSKLFSVHETEAEQLRIEQLGHQGVNKAFESAYGIKEGDTHAQFQKTDELARVVDLGTFENQKPVPERVNLQLSKFEMIKFWQELQRPGGKENWTDPKGNGYSPKMVAAIEGQLTPEDLKFAKVLFQTYGSLHEILNPVIRRTRGVDLGRDPNYSPFRPEFVGNPNDTGLAIDMAATAGARNVRASSTMERTGRIYPMKHVSALDAMQRHIAEVAHYAAWYEKLQELRHTFSDNAQVKHEIEKRFGPQFNRIIDSILESFVTNNKRRADVSEIIGQEFGSNVVRSVLQGKLYQAVLQWGQGIAFAKDIPVAELPEYAARVLNQIRIRIFDKTAAKAMEATLKGSPHFAARYNGLNKDLQAIAQNAKAQKGPAFKLGKFVVYQAERDAIGFIALTAGDRSSNLTFGAALYEHVLAKTGSPEEALKVFAKTMEATQQSPNLSQQSEFQRGGFFRRVAAMFSQGPQQITRLGQDTIRNVIAGRLSPAEGAKQLAVYWGLMAAVTSWIRSGGDVDPKRMAIDMLMAPLNGVPYAEEALNGFLSAIFRTQYRPSSVLLEQTWDLFTGEVRKIGSEIINGEDPAAIWFHAGMAATQFYAASRGLPAKGVTNMVEGANTIAEGIKDGNFSDVVAGARKFISISQQSINAARKKEENQ